MERIVQRVGAYNMRKFLLIFCIFVLLNIGGCQKTSDSFLSFETFKHPIGTTSYSDLTEYDFFSEDLVVIGEENLGDEDLIKSEAGMLINITDKEVIFSKNVFEKKYPASLTKLLTALLAVEHGDLEDIVTISYEASNITESGAKLCGFEEGDLISLDDLVHCILIYSGNDAAIAIADQIGGNVDDFNIMMNEQAAILGAAHSNFTNSHGLHNEEHYSTLYDIYLIFNEFIKSDTLREIVGISSYTAEYKDKDGNPKEISMDSTNLYLSENFTLPEGFIIHGGKTGNTFRAGNCLILLLQGPDNDYYISGLLKAPDRDTLYSETNLLLSLINGQAD